MSTKSSAATPFTGPSRRLAQRSLRARSSMPSATGRPITKKICSMVAPMGMGGISPGTAKTAMATLSTSGMVTMVMTPLSAVSVTESAMSALAKLE
jgi:hypothetical protein